jgi:hypothetical protein
MQCDQHDDLRCSECRNQGIITCFRVAGRWKCEECRGETHRMGKTVMCSLYVPRPVKIMRQAGAELGAAMLRREGGTREMFEVMKGWARHW